MKMCCISCGQSVVYAPAPSLFPSCVHLGVYLNCILQATAQFQNPSWLIDDKSYRSPILPSRARGLQARFPGTNSTSIASERGVSLYVFLFTAVKWVCDVALFHRTLA